MKKKKFFCFWYNHNFSFDADSLVDFVLLLDLACWSFSSSFKGDMASLNALEALELGLNVCVRFELPYVIGRPSHMANGLGHKCCAVVCVVV